jgi:hypothetical protein
MSIPFVDRASRLLFLLVSWWSVPSEDNDLVFLVNGDTPFSRVQNIAIFNESQTLGMCSNVDSDSLWHLPILKSDKDALKIVKSAQFATNMLSRSRTGMRRYGTRKNIKSSRIGEINRQRMVRRNKRIRQTREKGVSPLTRNTKSLSSEGTRTVHYYRMCVPNCFRAITLEMMKPIGRKNGLFVSFLSEIQLQATINQLNQWYLS